MVRANASGKKRSVDPAAPRLKGGVRQGGGQAFVGGHACKQGSSKGKAAAHTVKENEDDEVSTPSMES